MLNNQFPRRIVVLLEAVCYSWAVCCLGSVFERWPAVNDRRFVMSGNKMKRRPFLKQSAVIGAGLVVAKSGILRAGQSPNEKLNIAVLGVGGRGGGNMNDVRSENIVALCDVNAKNLASAASQFPDAKTYVDWRKSLEQT